MKKSLITSLAVILVLTATTAMAQQKMDGMKTMPKEKPATGQSVHMAKGKVTKVDTGAKVVSLAHEPVKSLN